MSGDGPIELPNIRFSSDDSGGDGVPMLKCRVLGEAFLVL